MIEKQTKISDDILEIEITNIQRISKEELLEEKRMCEEEIAHTQERLDKIIAKLDKLDK